MSKFACVDANIILRFKTNDPPDDAQNAAELFKAVDQGNVAVYLDEIIASRTTSLLRLCSCRTRGP